MRSTRTTLVVALLFLGAWPAAAQDSQVVGRIKSTAGSVSIVPQASTVPAQAGQALYQTDSVRTGADGHAGITLKKEPRFRLPEGSWPSWTSTTP